jgi:uncharacterized protein YkwD
MRKCVRILAAIVVLASTAPAMADNLAARVVDELNLARTSPQTYAERLREYRTWFTGLVVSVPGTGNPVLTREGVRAVDEAIRFLDHQRPLPALKPDSTLTLAAHDWVSVQGPRGGRGHFSPDGKGPGERVARRGGDRYVAENISYGSNEADLVVLQLIVDDGVIGRGHRNTVYDGTYAYAGAACGGHADYGSMCVIDYSAFPKGMLQPRIAHASL